MKRLKDWESRLIAYLAQASRRPFVPGQHDCALFTAGAVEAMTGENLVPDLGGEYTTLADGIKLLRKLGYRTHVSLVENLLKEIPPAFARKGDVVVVEGDIIGDALGIVQGENVYVLAANGLSLVSRLNIKRAFRV